MKKRPVKRIYAPLHFAIMPLMRFFLRVFRDCRFRVNKLERGACLILANHVNSTEPVMLEAAFNRPVCFLVQHSLLIEPVFRVLRRLTPFIGIDKGAVDGAAVMKCLRYVREGGVLAVYPEGNLTCDGALGHISPSVIGLVRMLRAPVIYYNTRGAYGADPRFGKGRRRGRTTGRVAGRRSPEEIAAMNDEELYADIRRMLTVDEFAPPCDFRSKKSAERLERVIYRCPSCGGIGTLKSGGRYVFCSCGLRAEYRGDLTFGAVGGKDIPLRVADWIADELEWVKRYHPAGDGVIFSDAGVKIEKRNPDLGFGPESEGEMIMTGGGIIVGRHSFGLGSVANIVLIKKQILMIFTSGQEVFRVSAPEGFCGLKYIHMFHRLRQLRSGISDGYYGM